MVVRRNVSRLGLTHIIRLIQRIRCIREFVVTVSCHPQVYAPLMTTLHVLHSHALLLVHAYPVVLRTLVHCLVVLLLEYVVVVRACLHAGGTQLLGALRWYWWSLACAEVHQLLLGRM